MNETSNIFSKEELENIAEFGEVLRRIQQRLLKEGVIKIENGKVIWLKDKPKYE